LFEISNEILSLIAAVAGTAGASVTGSLVQMRETTKAQAHLEHGKPASSSVASPAPGHFGCQPAGCDRIWLPQRLGQTKISQKEPGIRRMSVKLSRG
jgi:hypothetical protein